MTDLKTLEADIRAKLAAFAREFDRVGGMPAKSELVRMLGELSALIADVPGEAQALIAKVKDAFDVPLMKAAEAAQQEFHAVVTGGAAAMPRHLLSRLVGDLQELLYGPANQAQGKAAPNPPPTEPAPQTQPVIASLSEAGAAETAVTGAVPPTTMIEPPANQSAT